MFAWLRRSPKAPPGIDLLPYRAHVHREDRGTFAALHDRHVLIYWPHGVGDFVHLGHVLPALEPSNTYHVMRYGDEFTAMLDGDRCAQPLRSGYANARNAFGSSARDFHLGIAYAGIDGREVGLLLAPEAKAAVENARISDVLWTDYPDPAGKSAFPYHTKARSLIASLTTPRRRADVDFEQRLPSSLSFSASVAAQRMVDEHLTTMLGPGEELCLVLGGGHTAPRKNWAEDDIMVFARELERRRPRARILVLDTATAPRARDDARRLLFLSAFLTGGLFGYGDVLKALLARARIFVGVPAGPFHLAMARGDLPCVGLWKVHHPLLYDEPHALSRHLVAATVARSGLSGSRGVRSTPAAWRTNILALESDAIASADIVAAVEEILEQSAVL